MGNQCGTTTEDDCDVLSLKSDDPPEYTTSRMDFVFDGLCRQYIRCLRSGSQMSMPLKNALQAIYEFKFQVHLAYADSDLPICVLRYLDARDNEVLYVHKTAAELRSQAAVIVCGKSTPV